MCSYVVHMCVWIQNKYEKRYIQVIFLSYISFNWELWKAECQSLEHRIGTKGCGESLCVWHQVLSSSGLGYDLLPFNSWSSWGISYYILLLSCQVLCSLSGALLGCLLQRPLPGAFSVTWLQAIVLSVLAPEVCTHCFYSQIPAPPKCRVWAGHRCPQYKRLPSF